MPVSNIKLSDIRSHFKSSSIVLNPQDDDKPTYLQLNSATDAGIGAEVGVEVKTSLGTTALRIIYNEETNSSIINAYAATLDLQSESNVKIQGNIIPSVAGTPTHVLATDGAGTLYWRDVSLATASDVVITAPQNNHILKYNSTTTKWVNSSVNNLVKVDELFDAVIFSPVQNQVLTYKGAAWVNSPVEWVNIVDKPFFSTVSSTGSFLDLVDVPTTLSGYGITDAISSSQAGVANGVATLDVNGKLIASQAPSISITETFVVSSQAAMLALAAETGDVAVRTDLNKSFILTNNNPAVLGSWQELLSPTSAVETVAGRTGNIILSTADIGGLSTVASTGNYTDLLNRPLIPTLTSQLVNDLNFISGNQLITVTGDASGSGTTAISLTLANSGVSAGTYGTATHVPVITVDSKGRVTVASNSLITPDWSSITNKPTTIAGYGITDALTLSSAAPAPLGIAASGVATTASRSDHVHERPIYTFTGDATGSGSSLVELTLSNTGIVAGTYNKVTVDSKGRVIASAALAALDVTSALGYTPINSAGGTFAGSVSVSGALSVAGASSFPGGISTPSISGLPTSGIVDDTAAISKGFADGRYATKFPGSVIQMVSSPVAAQTGTSTVTLNNNTPTSAQGTEVWSNTITPTSATSSVHVTGSFICAHGNNSRYVIAHVFRDTIYVGTKMIYSASSTGSCYTISLDFVDAPATTSPVTYSVRVASNNNGTWYVGRIITAYFNGGLATSTIVLTEVSA